jgi:hypothetical protein
MDIYRAEENVEYQREFHPVALWQDCGRKK